MAPDPTPTPQPTPAPQPTATLVATPTPLPALPLAERPEVQEYAAHYAGGPGAIYVGDLGQLAGSPPHANLGDREGKVQLAALEEYRWLYDSDYYRDLLERANLGNPTQLVSTAESILIKHTCVSHKSFSCNLLKTYFAPIVADRTQRQVEFSFDSYPDQGVRDFDSLKLVRDGTLDSAEVFGGHVAGDVPAIDVENLWGLYFSAHQQFEALQPVYAQMDDRLPGESGAVVLNRNWYPGSDHYLFCRDPIDSLDDFIGKRILSHGPAIASWIEALGARPQFVMQAEGYLALERGIMDCAISGAKTAHEERWYEVSNDMIGPLPYLQSSVNILTARQWEQIPVDLQQILLEEAARLELENLRLFAAGDGVGVSFNLDTGIEYSPFSQEVADYSHGVVPAEYVIPEWIKRVGGPASSAVAMFNEHVSPVVGLRIEPDGTVAWAPITRGPFASESDS